MIQEPMTVATDYVLAMLSFACGIRLLRRDRSAAQALWVWVFLVLAVAALSGGTTHGFGGWLPAWQDALVWKAALWSIGLAAFLLLAAAGAAVLPAGPARILVALAGLKLAISLVWTARHDEFHYVLYDYALSVLAIAVMHSRAYLRRKRTWARWVVGGALLSLAAAAVQQSGFEPHKQFNHNDLAHVVLMGSFWMYWRGARDIRSGERTTSPGPSGASSDQATATPGPNPETLP